METPKLHIAGREITPNPPKMKAWRAFLTFFDALYWATISLTTVGYGDIYAISTTGKIITMISSFLGIAIVALPAGIITAGYMKEIKEL